VKKKASGLAEDRSPLPLRVMHGLVFAGFAALALVAGWPEVEHLVRAQVQPYNAGPPPRVEMLWAVGLAVVGLGVVLVQAVRGRSARLLWSVLILVGAGLAMWGNREGPPAGRTADAANLKILQTARTLHGRMVGELQAHGEVPEAVEPWQSALEQVAEGLSPPVRTRGFTPLPYRIQKVSSPEALPADAPPGTLLLYVMEGGAAYELHAVGISRDGEPWRLRDPQGEPLVFRGAYNPELAPAE
jgi:hypothetical protein